MHDNYLEDRLNNLLTEKKVTYRTIKMMGGLCYMVHDKMCVGIIKGLLMCRVGPEAYTDCLAMDYTQATVFTDRPMKGWSLSQRTVIIWTRTLKHGLIAD